MNGGSASYQGLGTRLMVGAANFQRGGGQNENAKSFVGLLLGTG